MGYQLVVGFDTEYEREAPGRNRLICISYWAIKGGATAWGGIIISKQGERPALNGFLRQAIEQGLRERHITRWPEAVLLAAHWNAADVPMFADFAEWKSNLAIVRKSFVTKRAMERAIWNEARHSHKIAVHLRDTLLWAPASNASLADLGELHGVPKVTIPAGMIEHIGQLVESDPALFADYALTDARIAALHTVSMQDFTGDSVPRATLSAIGLDALIKLWRRYGIKVFDVCGKQTQTKHVWQKDAKPDARKIRKLTSTMLAAHMAEYENLITACYHGGRSETFWYGPTARETWYEHDIKAAYPTALAAIRMPNWQAAFPTTRLADFQADTMGFARVRFSYPPDTRYPGLPIEDADGHGLIYVLHGEAYVTAPEIAVARRQGAQIEILNGVVIPPKSDERPFGRVIFAMLRAREQMQNPVESATVKEIVNSIYGLTAQGLKKRTVFDAAKHDRVPMEPSVITCGSMAALQTGLVRAMLCEIIASLPDHYSVLSVTTDSIMTDAPLTALPLGGPVATIFRDSARRLRGYDAAVLETKSTVNQLLPLRTRIMLTLEPGRAGDIKIAHVGMRAPVKGKAEENAWFVAQAMTRAGGEEFIDRESRSAADIYRDGGDLTMKPTTKRMTLDPDWKRALVDFDAADPRHVAADSQPWATIDEFVQTRKLFDSFTHQHRPRTLRTDTDVKDWLEYQRMDATAKQGIRRTPAGVVGQAAKLVVRAYGKQTWGLTHATPQKALVAILKAAGVPVGIDAIKKACSTRDAVKPLPEHTIAPTPEVMAFLQKVETQLPMFNKQAILEIVTDSQTRDSGVKIADFIGRKPAENSQSATTTMHICKGVMALGTCGCSGMNMEMVVNG